MSRDQISNAVLTSLAAINDQIEGWDRPASVWVLMRELLDGGMVLGAMEVIPNVNGITGLEGVHPTDALGAIADHIVRSGQRPPIEPPFAAVFISEAWMVAGKGEEDFEAIKEAGRTRSVHRREDKVEIRTISAVDLAGFRYTSLVGRDEEAFNRSIGDVPRATVHRPGEGERYTMDGYAHDMLEKFLQAVT